MTRLSGRIRHPGLLILLVGVCMAATDDTSVPSPISFQPTEYWDGDDGAWSTFAVQIGTAPQAVRLLPSITGNSIWTVWSYACRISDLTNCASARGDTFDFTASSTWDDIGNYSLPLNPQHYLPYYGGAVVGYDNVTLDWQGNGGVSLSHQVIFAYAADDFHIGSIGLDSKSINVSSYNYQIPSLLGTLRQQNLIPSASWGYLAGASYHTYPVSGFGSLTLGGYDTSRFKVNSNLTLSGGTDPYRPYLLGIESIVSQDTDLLAEPIITALDSLTTQIWLPISACEAFETAFGLVWNETYQLYLLNEAQHSALQAKNASVTFVLSTGISNSTDRLNITLPYAAFDLKASPPLAGNQTYYYFPLKQAQNETQYTLGRTILQEIYILSDHERGYTTLYEATYPEASVRSNIVTICPPNSTICLDVTSQLPNTSKALSTAATAGLVVAIVVVSTVICVIIWLKCFRRRDTKASSTDRGTSLRRQHATSAYIGTSEKPELAVNEVPVRRTELEGHYGHGKSSLAGSTGPISPTTGDTGSSTLGASSPGSGKGTACESGGAEVQELSVGDAHMGATGAPESSLSPPPRELPGAFIGYELPGSTTWHGT